MILLEPVPSKLGGEIPKPCGVHLGRPLATLRRWNQERCCSMNLYSGRGTVVLSATFSQIPTISIWWFVLGKNASSDSTGSLRRSLVHGKSPVMQQQLWSLFHWPIRRPVSSYMHTLGMKSLKTRRPAIVNTSAHMWVSEPGFKCFHSVTTGKVRQISGWIVPKMHVKTKDVIFLH